MPKFYTLARILMPFATDSTTIGIDAWQSVLNAMTSQISVPTVIAVLAGCVSAGIGLVFMWWGVRKTVRSLMSAFKKGRLSV